MSVRLTHWFKPLEKMGATSSSNTTTSIDSVNVISESSATSNKKIECSPNLTPCSFVENVKTHCTDVFQCSTGSEKTDCTIDLLQSSSGSNVETHCSTDKLQCSSDNDAKIDYTNVIQCSSLSISECQVKSKDPQEESESDFKSFSVAGIHTMEELENICVKFNLKMNSDPCHLEELKKIRQDEENKSSNEEEYEVEEITKCRVTNGVIEYRVKWKGWTSQFNTWENISNLKNCGDIVDQFHTHHNFDRFGNKRKRETKEDVRKTKKAKIERLIGDLAKREDYGSLLKLRGIPSTISENRSLNKLVKEVKNILKTEPMKKGFLEQIISSKNGKLDEFLAFVERRKETLTKLKEWEEKINNLPGLQATIKVENNVDFEGPPEQFVYITDYKAAQGIIIPDDPPVGCDCVNCYDMRKSCCSSQSGNAFAYSRFGTLNVGPGTPIYECNKRCQCGPDCLNRVVQKGRQVKLSIFRTENGCGWGVKTLEKIKKGSFVMEYVGEVITNEEADKRGKVYDAIGRTYLFDLDYDDLETLYTVDAATYGNVSHFMNHSCDPNLVVFAVWINNLDPKLPRLAFFAKRDIKAYEELNFDYTMSTAGNATELLYRSPKNEKETSSKDKSHSIICKCGAPICKGYVF